METLIASAILFAGVLAVISAIMTGQQKAIEAEHQVRAALAAEEVMGQLIQMPYEDLDSLPSPQPAGDMFAFINVIPFDEELPGLGVRLHGRTVRVRVMETAGDARPLAEVSHFVPEPPS
jgi:hypothetical protein